MDFTIPADAPLFSSLPTVALSCQTRPRRRASDPDEFHATFMKSSFLTVVPLLSLPRNMLLPVARDHKFASQTKMCHVTAVKSPIPADAYSVPSHGIEAVRSSRDGVNRRN